MCFDACVKSTQHSNADPDLSRMIAGSHGRAEVTATSGGIPLTRARLARALADIPVTVTYTGRNRPWCWYLAYVYDRSRHLPPTSEWTECDFVALRDQAMRDAAAALTTAGYVVEMRTSPDPDEVARLAPGLRAHLADVVPRLQPVLVPDEI